MSRAVVILPTYNEEGNIRSVIEGVFAQAGKKPSWDLHILVVESTSQDRTDEIVTGLQKNYKKLHILRTKKEGLGKAYIRGFEYALNILNADIIFQMDADLSHEPAKIPAFLSLIESGADFVIGSRYTKGGSIPENWDFHRKLFSVLGNWIIRIGFMNMKITDWTSGFRAIRAPLIRNIIAKVDNFSGYVFQVAILDNALKNGATVKELPIQFKDRKEGKSKIDSIEYIIQTLLYVFLESSFVKFVLVGGTGFLLDSIILYILALKLHFPPWFAKLISAETVIISNFTLNNFWSFSHKQLDLRWKTYFRGLLKFNIVSSGNIFIQTIGISVMTYLFGKSNIILYNALIIILLVIPYSYFFYNKFIWKDSR
ncbi:MAG: glycosyltransferase [Patescibacteria group bacterium]|nr:glycosyltransferase [Patescibacteria group bacterium]